MNTVQAHAILNAQTASVLAGERVIYGNTINSSFSKGNLAYVSQRVIFRDFSQFELGGTERHKAEGTVVFDIYERAGEGNAARNRLTDKINLGFASKALGGLTLLQVKSLGESSALNWVITTRVVNFFFYTL